MARARDEDVRHRREFRDRRKIPHRVERQLHHAHVDRHYRNGRDEQRVTVGIRLRDDVSGDHAASAAPVVVKNRLAQFVAELDRDRTGDDVRTATRRERHDPADGLYGVASRRGSFSRCGRRISRVSWQRNQYARYERKQKPKNSIHHQQATLASEAYVD
jgi:hypothetical protein